MITVKDAIKAATQYLGDVYPAQLEGILPEEIEGADDFWDITLGFNKPVTNPKHLTARLGIDPQRVYKVFRVRKDDGRVEWMKIRQLAAVGR